MKPITFENLRRLIGGRRKNKDRNDQSPFKRSESFKRISIRRNYLDGRGQKGGRNPTRKNLPLPEPPAASECRDRREPDVQRRRSVTPPPPASPPQPSSRRPTARVPEVSSAIAAPVIDYGEWIRCIRAEEDLNNLKKIVSPPTPPNRYYRDRYKELDDSSRADSAISLGRIWMDAPMLPPAAPRSLELPARPVTDNERRAHHSLESALKDKRDDRPVPNRRFHRYPHADCKSASRSSVATSTCSGKDSGFSVSVPGLSDPPQPSRQLFRKKASKQRPSVSAAQQQYVSPSVSSQELYQVVVARAPLRHHQQLKLDPMMFVAPDKRRAAVVVQSKRPVVEIRDYCVPKDARLELQNDEDQRQELKERLYESISKGRCRWQDTTDDADTEDDRTVIPRVVISAGGAAPNSNARNRVKRKKSARRNIKYVVKPVRRAPSAASRKPSVAAKTKSAWISSKSRQRTILY